MRLDILSLILNTPLLLHPRKAAIAYNVLARAEAGGGMVLPDLDAQAVDSLNFKRQPNASRFEGEYVKAEDDGWRGVEPFMRTRDGTAIINAVGSLVNRGAWVGANSGMVSHEGLIHQLQRAARDPKSKAIALDIDSPGGQAAGAFELAALVRKINAEKPVIAVVGGMAASGGYSLASGAKRVVTSPSGLSGSIGVVYLHMDHSQELADAGVKPTLIFTGKHKVDGHPFGPLPDDVLADLQREQNGIYESFVATVASGRGRRMSAKAVRETEAAIYRGEEAVTVGLADAVGTFDEVVADLAAKHRRAEARPGKAKGPKMATLTQTDDDIQAEARARTEAAVKDAETKAAAKARDDIAAATALALKNERARMATILADPKVRGRESFAAELAAEMPDAPAERIVALIEKAGPAPVQASVATPATIAAVGKELTERAATTNVNALPVGGQDTFASAADDQVAAGWKSAKDKHNAMVRQAKERAERQRTH